MFSLKFKEKIYYGWVVVGAFFIVGVILCGIQLSFGVFFESIESAFHLNRAETSAVSSVNMLLGGVCAFLAGWALDRYGPKIVVLLMGLFTGLSLLLTSQTDSLWQLFITYSLLLAMGTGALFVVPMSAASRWFDKKRGLALGITSSGGGLGIFIMAPFATYLISNFSWRTAYIVIGLIAWLIMIPLSRLLKRDPYEIGALPDGVKSDSNDMGEKEGGMRLSGLSLPQVFRTRSFWLVILIWLLTASTMFLVMTHLVRHARDINFSPMEAAATLSLIGGISIAGRVLLATVSDRIGTKVTAIFCALLQAGAMVWLIWAQDLWMLYLFALVYGCAEGGMIPVMAALVSDTFGLGRIGVILGLLEISFGIGAAIGPTVGGLIFDARDSYSLAFLLGAAAMLVVTLLISLIRRETNGNFISE